MGMFDDLLIEGDFHPSVSAGSWWQTKSLGCEMDKYKLDAEGQLWHEEYDIEDQSDPDAEGFGRLIGMLAQVNQRWVKSSWTGELEFYKWAPDKGWTEGKAVIVRGHLDGDIAVIVDPLRT